MHKVSMSPRKHQGSVGGQVPFGAAEGSRAILLWVDGGTVRSALEPR